ncbi:hypothetical protein [Streptomyces sp. NPDC059452]|uniref:hypothetical protein n=1 Tax=Streptomyces sp. NPDC059452 TaxID=3346835 RepID=UPI0036B4D71D
MSCIPARSRGRLTGYALGETSETNTPSYDLLRDILAVTPEKEPRPWNDVTASTASPNSAPTPTAPGRTWSPLNGPHT